MMSSHVLASKPAVPDVQDALPSRKKARSSSRVGGGPSSVATASASRPVKRSITAPLGSSSVTSLFVSTTAMPSLAR